MGRPFIDETGNEYGKLTVIKFTRFDNRHNAWFLCKCTCGNELEVRGYCLRRGDNVACGCSSGYKTTLGKSHPNFVDKTGNRYGKLTVIKFNAAINKQATWVCECDCGNIAIIPTRNLNKKGTHSCGCDKKLKEGEGCFNLLFSHYKRQAKKRNLSWNISKDTFRKLTKQTCFYCGTEPSNIKRNERSNGDYIYNGVDRINSDVGYETSNVVSCCARCNWMKSNLSLDDFKNHIKLIYEYWARF